MQVAAVAATTGSPIDESMCADVERVVQVALTSKQHGSVQAHQFSAAVMTVLESQHACQLGISARHAHA